MQTRDLKIDVIKGIAILGVVWAHLHGILTKEFYIFHIPVFFFLSGYLYHRKPNFIAGKIKSLLLPFFIFNAIFATIYYFQGGEYANRINLISWCTPSAVDGPAWFLLSLFTVNIFYFIFDKFIKRKSLLLIAIIIIAAGFYYWEGGNILEIRLSMISLLFFAVGRYAKDNDLIKKAGKGCIIAAIIIYALAVTYCELKPMLFDLHGNSLPKIFITYYLSALAAIFLLMKVDRFSVPNRFNRFMASIGNKSLYIMALHMPYMWELHNFLFRRATFLTGEPKKYFAIILTFIILSAASYLIAAIATKAIRYASTKSRQLLY